MIRAFLVVLVWLLVGLVLGSMCVLSAEAQQFPGNRANVLSTIPTGGLGYITISESCVSGSCVGSPSSYTGGSFIRQIFVPNNQAPTSSFDLGGNRLGAFSVIGSQLVGGVCQPTGTPDNSVVINVSGEGDNHTWHISGTQTWTVARAGGAGCSGGPGTAPESNVNNIVLSSGATPPTTHTLNITGTVTAEDCTSVHTVEVRLNGVTMVTGSTSGNGSSGQQGVASLSSSDDLTGQSYAIYVDGFNVAGGTITYTCTGGENPVCSFSAFAQQAFDCSATPTPTPTPSATPTATATPTPRPTATPYPTVTPGPSLPPGGGGPGGEVTGNVTVENPNDFYAPVRRALEDAGSGLPAADLGRETFEDVDTSDRGHLDDLEGAVQDQIDSVNSVKDDVSGKVDGLRSSLNTLPTSYGSVGSLDLGASAFGHGYTSVISLSGGNGQMISLFRAFCVWVMSIAFLFLTIRALTYQN